MGMIVSGPVAKVTVFFFLLSASSMLQFPIVDVVDRDDNLALSFFKGVDDDDDEAVDTPPPPRPPPPL